MADLGTITQENKTFYDRTLLSRLNANCVWAQFADKDRRSIPKHEGDTVNFRRFNSLAVATTPLTEGTTPAGSDITVTAVTATVAQYGDFVPYTDKIDMVGIDPVVTEIVEVQGEQAGETVDTLVRDELTAGTNVQRVAGRAARVNIAAGDNINTTEIRKAVRTMRRNKVKPVVDGYYIGFVGADVEYDITGDADWKDVNTYNGSGEQIFKNEIGKYRGVKFIRTDNPKIFTGAGAAGIDVHSVVIIGKNAYGMPDVDGSAKPETIIKPVGSAGSADPLNQRGSVGWKCMFTAKRLQELAILRIECAISA